MTKILAAVVIAGCATMFFSALPADARLASNGLTPMPERLASNGLAPKPVNGRLATNGVRVTGLDFSRIGQKALGR
ncbi:MAG TPA: hypothetical protein VFX56_07590 [Nitrospira sp.]|nr:hypothetical protein [Nitrospira sp.]